MSYDERDAAGLPPGAALLLKRARRAARRVFLAPDPETGREERVCLPALSVDQAPIVEATRYFHQDPAPDVHRSKPSASPPDPVPTDSYLFWFYASATAAKKNEPLMVLHVGNDRGIERNVIVEDYRDHSKAPRYVEED